MKWFVMKNIKLGDPEEFIEKQSKPKRGNLTSSMKLVCLS
jgi:hypothetical protein